MKNLHKAEESKKEILIVEDSETQASVLRWILEQKGYKVSRAKNGAQGIDMVCDIRPALVISDVIMPVMDGYQLCREIKRSEKLKGIPVILLTRMNEPADVLKGLEAGADNYVTKPFDENYLVLKVKVLLESPMQLMNRPEGKCVEVAYSNKVYEIRAGRAQTLNFLFSTYENVVWQNIELNKIQGELRALNEKLEELVEERTAELKKSNDELSREISEHMRAKEKLKELTADLEGSNRELEQFAYVASHDLKEPLRIVTSYMKLLEKRYRDRLDADAFEFIKYAVDSSERMQRMVDDLLAFSRVETIGREFGPVNSNDALDKGLENLHVSIKESGAVIERGVLPVIKADGSQLAHVFQNLIGNAIKFRGEGNPQIRVFAKEEDKEWVFTVKDSGVGFDMQYKDKLFNVFSRLHGREYPGSGIGLATCKRIVERHGGRIWAESEPGKGAAFHFSIFK